MISLSRRTLIILSSALAVITGGAVTYAAIDSPAVVASASDWQTVHDLACANGAVNCGPDVTTSTTIGGTTSTSNASSSTTTTSVSTTTTSSSSTTIPPSTTTSVVTTTTVPPSTTTTIPSSTTTVQSTMPNATNTGVPAGTSLSNYTGPCNITASNVTIDAKIVNCALTVSGSNFHLSRFQLTASSFNAITLTGSGAVIEDGSIDCGGVDSYGINMPNGGNNAMMRRLNISNCGNAVEPGTGSTFRDSFVHDLKGSNAEHVDGVSFDYGQDNVNIIHNTVDVSNSRPTAVSALMLTNYGSGCTGIVITDNVWRGGGYTIYFEGQWSGAITVEFSRNRVALGYHGAYELKRGPVTVTGSGNVDADTGATVNF